MGDIGAGLIGAVLGSGGVAGAWFKSHFEANAQDNRALRERLEAFQDRVGEFRALCTRRGTQGAASVTDSAMADARHLFDVARDRCLNQKLRTAGEEYAQTAESYASGDPAVGVDAERVAYEALMDQVFVVLKKRGD